jgi:hypothetical protein
MSTITTCQHPLLARARARTHTTKEKAKIETRFKLEKVLSIRAFFMLWCSKVAMERERLCADVLARTHVHNALRSAKQLASAST